MSNQQVWPQTFGPGAGDILTTPGSPLTTVTGIQTAPVINQYPLNGQILIFDGPTNRYIPSSTTNTQANKSIQVNGIVMSDDYEVSVNDVLGISNSAMFVNGA